MSQQETSPDIGGATLRIATPGIHSVHFLGTADRGGAGVDDFTFNPVSSATLKAIAIDIKPGSDLNGITPRGGERRACDSGI